MHKTVYNKKNNIYKISINIHNYLKDVSILSNKWFSMNYLEKSQFLKHNVFPKVQRCERENMPLGHKVYLVWLRCSSYHGNRGAEVIYRHTGTQYRCISLN